MRIADPVRVMQRYPHQLSGGMQQRVVIAMALACDPKLLVLDEPTTGLDATVEAEVLDLVRALRSDTDAAILLIAHNLGVIRTMCDRVGVMYAGKVVEEGPAQQVFDDPQHPYTVGLLSCLPRHGIRKGERLLTTIPGTLPQIGTPLPTCVFVDRCPLVTDDLSAPRSRRSSKSVRDGWTRCHHADRIDEILAADDTEGVEAATSHRVVFEMRDVSKTFRQHRHDVPALVGVDLGLEEGETLGLVGESGSGKSTLAKAMLGIHAPDEGGELEIDGNDRGRARPATARRTSGEPCRWCSRTLTRRSTATGPCGGSSSGRSCKLTGVKGRAADDRVEKLAESLRLSPRHLDLKPRQLSGGLKQRVAIARAFAGDPRIVVCDEPTSALDVSVQAAILNVLAELQAGERTSYLFISHDLGVVRYLADRIAVMYLGRIMEIGRTDEIFDGPHHPYTEALLSAVPSVDGEPATRISLAGEIPSPGEPTVGMRVPHPLSPLHRGHLRRDRAARRRAVDRSPHPLPPASRPTRPLRRGRLMTGRAGGRAARVKSRADTDAHPTAPAFIRRQIPNYELLGEEGLALIEQKGDQLLAEVGIDIHDDADPSGSSATRARRSTAIACASIRDTCARCARPRRAEFTQHARNPDRSVEIGGDNVVFAPAYGSPFVRDLAGGRRYAIARRLPELRQAGVRHAVAAPLGRHRVRTGRHPGQQAPPRHGVRPPPLHRQGASWARSPQPSRAEDSVEMARIAFGADFLESNCVILGNVNVNSPLVWDGAMTGAIRAYAARQPGAGRRAVHPRRSDGTGHARRRDRPGPRRDAGGRRARPTGATGFARHLRQLPVVDGAALGRADVRHARAGDRLAGRRADWRVASACRCGVPGRSRRRRCSTGRRCSSRRCR